MVFRILIPLCAGQNLRVFCLPGILSVRRPWGKIEQLIQRLDDARARIETMLSGTPAVRGIDYSNDQTLETRETIDLEKVRQKGEEHTPNMDEWLKNSYQLLLDRH